MENNYQEIKQAYTKMAQVCSRSEQCEWDIRKKLAAFNLSAENTDEIISKLKEENFLNDARYVKAFISDKFRINKWGKVKLRYSLKTKKLPDNIIEEGLENIDAQKYKAVLIKIMKDKAKTIKKKNKFEKMGQIIRFAQSRGFEPEKIHRYMDQVIN